MAMAWAWYPVFQKLGEHDSDDLVRFVVSWDTKNAGDVARMLKTNLGAEWAPSRLRFLLRPRLVFGFVRQLVEYLF
jgi:hypothetical protein